MVGLTGFEPATPYTPCKCATRLRYSPFYSKVLTNLIKTPAFVYAKDFNELCFNFGTFFI